MSLYDDIKAVYPDIEDEVFLEGTIILQNDSDGLGDFIVKWDYEKPIPEGMKFGK